MDFVKKSKFPQLKRLGFKLESIKADGSCQFGALSDQLYGFSIHANTVRKRVVKYMQEPANHAKFINFVTANAGGGLRRNALRSNRRQTKEATPTPEDRQRAYQKYLLDMSGTESYGDHLTLQAFCFAYHVDVTVYRDDGDTTVVKSNEAVRAPRMLHVARHNFEHYSSVRNKKDGSRPESATSPTKECLPWPASDFPEVRQDSSSKGSSPGQQTGTSIAKSTKGRRIIPGMEFMADYSDDDTDDETPVPPKGTPDQKPRKAEAKKNIALEPTKISPQDIVTETTGAKTVISDPVFTMSQPSMDMDITPPLSDTTRAESTITQSALFNCQDSVDPKPTTLTKTVEPKPVQRRMSVSNKDIESLSPSSVKPIPPLSSLHFRKKSKSPPVTEPPKHEDLAASIAHIKEEALKPAMDWRYPERREKVGKKEPIRGPAKRWEDKNQEIRALVFKRRVEKPLKRWVGKKEDIHGPIKRSREVEDSEDEEPLRGPKRHRRMLTEEDEDPIRVPGPKRRRQIEIEEDEDPIRAPRPKSSAFEED